MNPHELRRIFLTVAIVASVAWMMGRWQTKSLREDVASLATQCQLLEREVKSVTEQAIQSKIKLRNTENSIARGEVAIAALEATRMKATEEPQRYTLTLLHILKRGFNDIQHQVAAGRFPGLALTDGYMELKQVLNNPAFEEMLARDHGIPSRE